MNTEGRVLAQAKVNLFLRILARETSGYHQLETLFCRIDLADEVVLRRTSGARTLDCAGEAMPAQGLGPVEKNLAWRAAVAFLDATDDKAGFSIEITKHIPVGGGLGGGSADAGAVLRILNATSTRPLPLPELLRVAGKLGADVPFMTCTAPLALAWGRGDRLLTLPALPKRRCHVISAPFGVNTAAAYGWLAARERPAAPATAMPLSDFARWDQVDLMSHNDFEGPVFVEHPELGAVRSEVAEALGRCRMSGSGSTLFAFSEQQAPVFPPLPSGFSVVETATSDQVAELELRQVG